MKVDGAASPDTALLDIGDDISVPCEVRIEAASVNGYRVRMAARYVEEDGRYAVDSLTVEGQDGQEVTGEALRTIPVAKIARQGLSAALKRRLFPVTQLIRTSAGQIVQGTIPAGLTDDELENIVPTVDDIHLSVLARVYRIALLVGEAPTQAVAAYFEVPRSTAGRWVMRARDRGLLTVQDKRARKR